MIAGIPTTKAKSRLFVLVMAAVAMSLQLQGQVSSLEPLDPLPPPEAAGPVDETPALWFVELASPPAAEGTSPAQLRAEQASFRAAARAAGLQYTERFAFETLWNGLSVRINRTQLAALARVAGVKAIYPVEIIAPPPTATSAVPDLFTSVGMIGADIAHSELGLSGHGIKVAVMDTGIDVDQPDLGGDGVARSNSPLFPSARVPYGFDFVGDAYNADSTSPSYNPIPAPDPNPDDCGGHGTHVAGILGANGFVKGVAPGVVFGAYRVFGCEGSTSADIMIAAMERALADRMDVLNMSIGSAYQWPQYPTAQAADRLVNRGIVVVASIGNNGANGLYSAGAPGLGKHVIGVASYDNTHSVLPYFEVNGRKIGYVPMTYSGPVPVSGGGEIVYAGLACSPLPSGSLSGKIALIARGTCSFGQKAANAIDAGALAVLIYNNAPGVFSGTLGAPIDGVTPVVGISLEDGTYLRAQAAPVMMTWTDGQDSFASPTAGLISSFSSYGLSPDLALKPDLGAPGGNIYSTYPVEKGGYAVISGTSMASPHVAGAVALLLQASPLIPAKLVRDLLQNSADPARWWGNPALGFLDNAHRQGAGMVDIDDAILATTRISPGKISAGEGQAGPQTQRLTLENKAAEPVSYAVGYINALSTGGLITPGFFLSDATVSFSSSSVDVPAGGTAWVDATITPASGPLNGQYGGYIRFTPTAGGQAFSVPFAGFVGDYQAIQVLAPTANAFPWLAVLTEGAYYKVTAPSGWTFTMQGNDVPFVLVHLEHQSRRLRLELFASPSGKSWHRVLDEEYLPRNSTPTGFFALPFDGYTLNGRRLNLVPDGQYVLKLSVLKALGDEANPAHWETWTSPAFVIDRP